MSRLALFLFLAVMALGGPPQVSAEIRIPREAHTALWVGNVPAAMENLEASPLARVLADTEVGLAPGDAAISQSLSLLPISPGDPLFPVWTRLVPFMDMRLRGAREAATAVFPLTVEKLAETFDGQLAVYSTLYDLYTENNVEIVEWDLVVVAEFSEERRPEVERLVDSLLASVPRDARRRKVDFLGEEYFHIEYFMDEEVGFDGGPPRDDGLNLVQEIPIIIEYGYVDDKLLLAEGRGEPLKKAIRALKSEADGARLDGHPGYQRAAATLGDVDGQFHFYFDIPHHLRELKDQRSQREMLQLAQAIGLGQCGPVVARGDLGPAGMHVHAALPISGEPSGLFAIFAGAPENDFQQLALVPANAELAASLTVDLAQLYAQYRAAMLVIDPNAQRISDAAVSTVEGLTSVDFEDDILAYMNGEMVNYYYREESEGLAGGFYFPLGGGATSVDTINGVIRRLNEAQSALFDVEEGRIEGQTVWESKSPATPGARPGTFLGATTRGLIMATNGAELRALLGRMMDDRAGSRLLEDDTFRTLVRGVPRRGARGFVYQTPDAVATHLRRRLPAEARLTTEQIRDRVGPFWWNLAWEQATLRLSVHLEPAENAAP